MSATLRWPYALLPAAGLTLLAGCASSLSGVGGGERYACQAPAGTQCSSVSGTYANALQLFTAKLQDQPAPEGGYVRAGDSSKPVAVGPRTAAPPTVTAALNNTANESLRTPERVLKLWIAPWEDSDGDLHAASHVYVLIEHGRWRIEHVQPARSPRTSNVLAPATTVARDPEPAADGSRSTRTQADSGS